MCLLGDKGFPSFILSVASIARGSVPFHPFPLRSSAPPSISLESIPSPFALGFRYVAAPHSVFPAAIPRVRSPLFPISIQFFGFRIVVSLAADLVSEDE